MSQPPPSFIFRIDEIEEAPDAPVTIDQRNDWVPSLLPKANRAIGGGASGIWWYCNGQQIYNIPADQATTGSQWYKTYSAFYTNRFGFWILDSDALNSRSTAGWQPLRFDHDLGDYSSYLTIAAEHNTLACQRVDQSWPRMLLPSNNHGNNTPYQQYGSLKGELGIFLALLAFSMRKENLTECIPKMFDSRWKTHTLHHGRTDKRGVVVYIYLCPPHWNGSTRQDLRNYEDGVNGNRYYH
ncbi:hypothetical protein NX059_009695 [Plenodomus lindquistii]|nr:hypothetical protein NX059_009695 [Plenodomus lindquistii]